MGYIYETNVIDWDKANAYINYSRIKRILDETEDDNNVAAVITIEEAEYVLKIKSHPPLSHPLKIHYLALVILFQIMPETCMRLTGLQE